MHCVTVEFNGFKRLSSTRCNTDTHLLAFVGPNEAGKSSLLEALVWLSDPNAHSIAPKDRTRDRDFTESHVAVTATYELDNDDKISVAGLAVAEEITGFVLQRRMDGTQGSDALPTPLRDPRPFVALERRLERAAKTLARQVDAARAAVASEALEDGETSELPVPGEWLDAITEAVSDREASGWSDRVNDAAEQIAAWLEASAPTSRTGKPRDADLAVDIRNVQAIVNGEHPRDTARDQLLPQVPRYVQFTEDHRKLERVHLINDDEARRNLAPALINLLEIAELDVEKLWRHIEQGVGSSIESDIESANLKLRSFFEQAWNQSKVAVRLKLDSNRLELWLIELDNAGHVTDIEERSDGLLMFIALAAFVASQRLDVPPILLIDEAETHLHFDAQADLVGVLLKQVDATQVFYTTHSPGCLPTDLGTGIRLVQRAKNQPGISRIHSDFWTNQAPGFAPLLYAMGASAAAFSACRLAVLAEGAADMVLLPTLIRKATDLDDLLYQVAPGLANAHAYGMNVEEVAAKVVYLTDGDDQGATYRAQLREAKVPRGRIFNLPKNKASEDLVSRTFFIKVINTLLPKDVMVSDSDLPKGMPIAKALDDWAKKNGHSLGHVAIAYGLINNRKDIVFAPGAEASLLKLHEKFMTAFNISPS